MPKLFLHTHQKPCHLNKEIKKKATTTKNKLVKKMASGIFIFDIIATLALSGLLLFCYGDWFRQRLFVTLSVLLAWYFSFLIIFVQNVVRKVKSNKSLYLMRIREQYLQLLFQVLDDFSPNIYDNFIFVEQTFI